MPTKQQQLASLDLATVGEAKASVTDLSRAHRSETRYRGASRQLRSLASWMPVLGSGRSDLRENERRTLAARSRDAYRNFMIARAVATRLRTNVVGSGVVPQPSVDSEVLGISPEAAKELNRTIANEWNLWADDPCSVDIEGMLNFYGIQSLAEICAFIQGDTFVATPFEERMGTVYELKLQLIDAARVSNPFGYQETRTLCDGIEMTETGLPLRIHVRNRHPDDVNQTGAEQWQALEVWGKDTGRRRAFHIWNDKDQVGQVRGAPGLAPILEPLQTLEQYSRAELTAAVVSAMFTVFLKKDSTLDPFNSIGQRGNAFENQDKNLEDVKTEPGTSTLALAPGAILDLQQGEEPVFADPKRPNSGYDPFFNAIVTQMGAALEMPVDELMLRYQTSYSAARAAMLQAYRLYLKRRGERTQQFYHPVYCLWFDLAVAKGRIKVSDYGDPKIRAAYTRAIWTGPARGSMDELKEAQAQSERIKNGTSNRTIETAAASGNDYWSVQETAAREVKKGRADGTIAEDKPAVPGFGAPAKKAPSEPPEDPEDPKKPEDDSDEETEDQAEDDDGE